MGTKAPSKAKSTSTKKAPAAKKPSASKAKTKIISDVVAPTIGAPPAPPSKTPIATAIDVLFSFDTTGSMYPCLTQVRANIAALSKRLFNEIPGIRIGFISHGDYCDGDQAITTMDFVDASKKDQAIHFINNAPATGGGDSPECYELALHTARSFSWKSGTNKVVVLIGDDVPHGPNESQNKKKLDWRNELGLLLEAKINVYAVQALGRSHATKFYQEVARVTGGFHLELDQFSHINSLIMAVCFKQQGDDQLKAFEKELVDSGKMNRSVDKIIGRMLHRDASGRFTTAPDKLGAVSPSRFQVLDVPKDIDIKSFVLSTGADFKPGRGFYEFTKSVEVQAYKEVILMDRVTGDMFNGNKAREIAGLPPGSDSREITVVRPDAPGLSKYICFIQSTSVNRKLIGGTKFLYEVADWSR